MTKRTKAGCDMEAYKRSDWISPAARSVPASRKIETARGSPPGENPSRRNS